MRILPALLVFVAAAITASSAERINQEGRILGPEPTVTGATLFNTAAADAVLSAMQVLPVDSAWNEDISGRPLLANSAAMIAQIRADLQSNRRTLRAFHEMNFVLVPDGQPLAPIAFLDYPDESDPAPYPIPGNIPVETWPRETGTLTLTQWQQDMNSVGGDRHAIVVMPGVGSLWEMWQARLVGAQWQASNGAKFDLHSNTLRPAGWTSGDAAGLPMFPALVRYDECLRGMVEHAMRIVVRRSRREYIYPATHYASSTPATEVNVPAMGQRVRLRADFPIPDTWTIFERAVCLGLKKYGALVADNGNFFSISVTPDDRYPAGAFAHLASIDVNEFEVVQTTGATAGPRSPGAPTAHAGSDLATARFAPVPLSGSVTGTGIIVQWTKSSGPGIVSFGNAGQAATNATFGASGTYTLMLSARDGIHAVAYDAVVVTVTDSAPPDAGDARLANLSTRALVGAGAAVPIGGFTIAGPGPKKLVIRAAGPALTPYGVAGVLADPILTVFSGAATIALNDDWDVARAADFAAVDAAAWSPGSKDAAVVVTLEPGSYTAQVTGKDGTAGVALVEIYDADSANSPSQLVNLSTRAFVGTGENVQIGGFVIDGGPRQVLLRAAGPALVVYNVAGLLTDPVLAAFESSVPLGGNDNWDPTLAATFTAVSAFPWTVGSKDAATVLSLQPGSYTVHVTGGSTTGIALFEIYTLD